LEELRHDVGARCIFLADMQGQRLVETGATEELHASTLLALLAGGFATSSELARRFGNGESVNLNFHEGSRYEVYSANVGDSLFIAITYDRRVQTSRVGIVWHYTRGAINDLLDILSQTGKEEGEASFIDADFRTSLSRELDTLFAQGEEDPFAADAEEGAQGVPAPVEQGLDAPSQSRMAPEKEATAVPDDQPLFTFEEALARGLIDGAMLGSVEEEELDENA
jgi:hypothetical protein